MKWTRTIKLRTTLKQSKIKSSCQDRKVINILEEVKVPSYRGRGKDHLEEEGKNTINYLLKLCREYGKDVEGICGEEDLLG